jgi:hypothetical protein
MSKRKSNWTCSYCSNILKDPIIELPCGDSICLEHLDKKVIVLKKELEWKLCQLYEFYDMYNHNKNNLESNVKSHFEQIRSQIDQHRDKLKDRIDWIALKMMDETKIYEKMNLKSINESFFFSSFVHCKSYENELLRIEKVFRISNANLLIQSIGEMQQKKEKSSKDIQSKLNQMNQVKVLFKEINEFQPNLSLFNQAEETSIFGSIKFNQYTNTNSFDSEILTDVKQSIELIKLCEFSPNDKWSLLYRATRDGFKARDFHLKCDGHSNTLTILKAAESEFVFGGFTTADWNSTGGYKSDPNAFIFSLINNDNKPLKIKAHPGYHDHAIRCDSKCGPSFGEGPDIHIGNKPSGSYSNLGYSYAHPQYTYKSDEAQGFLAGSIHFQLDQIEVYQREEN